MWKVPTQNIFLKFCYTEKITFQIIYFRISINKSFLLSYRTGPNPSWPIFLFLFLFSFYFLIGPNFLGHFLSSFLFSINCMGRPIGPATQSAAGLIKRNDRSKHHVIFGFPNVCLFKFEYLKLGESIFDFACFTLFTSPNRSCPPT